MRFSGVPTWCATLAAICPTAASCSLRATRLAQREHPLVGLDQLLVAHAQLRGRFVDPFLQRLVEILEAPEHVVEPNRDRADLVLADDLGPRREIALRRRGSSSRGCCRSAGG